MQHSHAEECDNFCRLYCSTSDKNYEARNNRRKIDDIDYHVTDIDTKIFRNDLKMKVKGFCTAETDELYSGMRAHYHIYADPTLGISKFSV